MMLYMFRKGTGQIGNKSRKTVILLRYLVADLEKFSVWGWHRFSV